MHIYFIASWKGINKISILACNAVMRLIMMPSGQSLDNFVLVDIVCSFMEMQIRIVSLTSYHGNQFVKIL